MHMLEYGEHNFGKGGWGLAHRGRSSLQSPYIFIWYISPVYTDVPLKLKTHFKKANSDPLSIKKERYIIAFFKNEGTFPNYIIESYLF